MTTDAEVLARLVGVEGWLGDNEASFLYRLAQQCRNAGVIVEIGSWKGRSTICLACGSLAGQRIPVYAIDPHDFVQEPSVPNEGISRRDHLTTFGEFRDNLKRAGVSDVVHPIVATSDEAVLTWDRPIELLWIDGAHTYENASRDIQNWSPYLLDGGVIALHDSTPMAVRGVRRAVSERVLSNPFFTDVGIEGTITYATKSRFPAPVSIGKWKLLAMYSLFDLGCAVVPKQLRASLRSGFHSMFWRVRPSRS